MAKTFTFLLVILMATSLAAFGNMVIATPSGASGWWYTGIAPDDNNVDAFWDNPSLDDPDSPLLPGCNIGYWLNATSWPATGCPGEFKQGGGGPGAGNWEFFADSSSAAKAVGWMMEVPANMSTEGYLDLQLEIAGNRGTNVFGWYTLDSSGNPVQNQLYAGPASPNAGSTVNFSVAAGTQFGFYITGEHGTFYSGSLVGTPQDPNGSAGKLAIFRELDSSIEVLPDTFWIAAEDRATTVGENIGDYNDFVVKLTVVPEPGFYGLLAVGMSALFLAVRRRRQV